MNCQPELFLSFKWYLAGSFSCETFWAIQSVNISQRKDRGVLRRREENRESKNFISTIVGYFFSFLINKQVAYLKNHIFPHNLPELSDSKPNPSYSEFFTSWWFPGLCPPKKHQCLPELEVIIRLLWGSQNYLIVAFQKLLFAYTWWTDFSSNQGGKSQSMNVMILN